MTCPLHVQGLAHADGPRLVGERNTRATYARHSIAPFRLPRSSCKCCDEPARIMWAVSFTFKYLPNIIREFCTHVAVGDACALSALASHASNLSTAISRHPSIRGVWLGQRCRVCGHSQTRLPMMSSSSSACMGLRSGEGNLLFSGASLALRHGARHPGGRRDAGACQSLRNRPGSK